MQIRFRERTKAERAKTQDARAVYTAFSHLLQAAFSFSARAELTAFDIEKARAAAEALQQLIALCEEVQP